MTMLNKIFHGDCLEVMREIPTASVDMILCDLPYGTTACSWDVIIPFDKLWEQYDRVIKEDGAIVLTASQPFTTLVINSNISKFKYCWVWHKSKGADFVNSKNKPMRNHEDVVVFSKGGTANGSKVPMKYYPQGLIYSPKMIKTGSSKFGNIAGKRESHVDTYMAEYTNYPMSVLQVNNEGNTIHPTQKPVRLFEYLIKTYTNQDETVLDNCMGSGTTAIACINTGRNYIGIEKDEEYFNIINDRIKKRNNEIESSLFPREILLNLNSK